MKFTSKLFVLTLVAILTACSGSDEAISAAENKSLKGNKEWPIELVGALDIIDGGGFVEDKYMTWAVGSLSTKSGYGELSVYLDGNAAVDGRVDLDAEGEFRVWLGAPRTEYGHTEYEIVKVEKI
ncbi:hypothetical protein [Microbulbifer sp.]|uniref:hypothetical protein n=1 Tax=Microbulbifer sp. TaxID=1908541 RepID=UPI003F4066C1